MLELLVLQLQDEAQQLKPNVLVHGLLREVHAAPVEVPQGRLALVVLAHVPALQTYS